MSKVKSVSGFGSAASLDVGTSAGNIVQLDGSSKIPALDGSQLLNAPGGGSTTAALLSIVNVSSTPYNVSSSSANGTVFYLDVYSTGQILVYLPAASSVSSGTYFTFSRNDGGAYGYVLANGYSSNTDKLQGTQDLYQLRADDSITLVSDGSANWFYVGVGTQ